jgi:hypothetical protein
MNRISKYFKRKRLIREAKSLTHNINDKNIYRFKIDTRQMSEEEALKFATEVKANLYKKPLVNPLTGEIDFKYNPISIEEDFWMGSPAWDEEDIDILPGTENIHLHKK